MARELVAGGEAVFIVPDDGAQIAVHIASETVWLSQRKMADLFATSSDNIGLHLKNIYADGELAEAATAEDFSVVQREGRRQVKRRVRHYNLDAIISVGFRVNSKRGITFRAWANTVIKDRLRHDLSRRTEESQRYLAGLKNVELLADDHAHDARAVLDLIGRYARSWRLLLQYDENALPPAPIETTRMARLTLNQANQIVEKFKRTLAKAGQATDLFGRVRDDGLTSILGNLEQTWEGVPVYPNVDVRAAHLLYFVIKNHPFVDGNKRIGSLLFLHYLSKNERALPEESALVALALLIAESAPKHKEIVVRLIISLMSGAWLAATPPGVSQG